MSEKRVPLVSIDDLAITLGVSVSTVRSWVRDGEIPRQTYIRVGKTYRFEQEEVISALKEVSDPVEGASPKTLADFSQADKDAMTKAGFKIDWENLEKKNKAQSDDSDQTDSGENPLIDTVDDQISESQQTIKELIKIGKDRGFVTHDELDAGLPAEEYTPEEIDQVLSTLNEMGVSIVDIEHEEDPAALKIKKSHWSEQELLILRECWTHNMPISTIGRLIGKSRNAVAEKAFEIQLPKRENPNPSVSQDEPVEVPYLKAAENGDVNAQFFLAYLYADGGFNVEHDEEKSRHWYLKAAEQGHAEAQKICHQINQKYKISNRQYWLQWIDGSSDDEVLLELEENAADSLRDDKDFILDATKKNGAVFEFASDRLKNDYQVKHRVKIYWTEQMRQKKYDNEVFRPPFFLRDDEEFMLEVFRFLEVIDLYPSERLRDDKNFILTAIKTNGKAYEAASEVLQGNRELIHEAIRKEPSNYWSIPDSYRHDMDTWSILLHAFQIDDTENFFANNEEALVRELHGSPLLDRKEFVIELLALDGCSNFIYYLKNEFRADKEVALAAVKNDPTALLYVDPILSDDPDLMAEAAKVVGGQEDLEKDY